MDVQYPAAPAAFSATSRTTRFHTNDSTTTSKLIDIADISMAIGDKDILSGGHLQLTAGARYGLIGRNGVGKSLLLRSLAFRCGGPAAELDKECSSVCRRGGAYAGAAGTRTRSVK